ncbi:hypothetical protein CKO51_27270 [Rhodopirellula sp. SM50]|nr:hypothetical protein CKO51_27270 [Rhodopirellula sp. SM50]
MGLGYGAADLVLLPMRGPHRLVIVEAKLGHSQDAAAKVVGQLLMYYAGAQQFGARGLRLLREFASANDRRARSQTPKTLKTLSGGISPREAAWRELQKGRKLRPDQIRLFIALNGEPSLSLKSSLSILASQHALLIEVLSVVGVDRLVVWSPV